MPSSTTQERALRNQLVELGKKMYERSYIAGTDGNLSVRLGENQMLTTPSGVHKGMLQPEQIVKCDLRGQPVAGEKRKPSSEIKMHILVYQLRPEVRAAIHGHPVHAVALSLVGVSLAECLLPEPTLALGSIPTAPYATPTTDDVPESIRDLMARQFNALVLARHGTLTLGTSLEEAYLRLETLEHSAHITSIAKSIGTTSALPSEEVAKIEQIANDFGIARPSPSCASCGVCGQHPGEGGGALSALNLSSLEATKGPTTSSTTSSSQTRDVIDEITSTVLRRLGHTRVPSDT